MLFNYVFYQLSNSISSDYSTLFVYFNLELYHTLEICAPSITLINRTYLYLPGLILNLLTCGNYIANYNVNMHPLNLTLIVFTVCRSLYKKKFYTKSSYFTDILGSYDISSKYVYKFSFTLIGKTHTKHLPDQPDSVIFILFANFIKQQHSSNINVLPNINSGRLNLNVSCNQNH